MSDTPPPPSPPTLLLCETDSESDEGSSAEASPDLIKKTLQIEPGDLPSKLANGCARTKKKGDKVLGVGKGDELTNLVIGL